MTRRAAFRQADLSRALKEAKKVGFQLKVVDGEFHFLPTAANAPLNEAEDAERRMRDAFGE